MNVDFDSIGLVKDGLTHLSSHAGTWCDVGRKAEKKAGLIGFATCAECLRRYIAAHEREIADAEMRLAVILDMTPKCPSEHCPMCNGEACNKCGAGCWRNDAPLCEHDVIERHEKPMGQK